MHFIEKCILNVIEQKYSGLEHIIIDGASTDGTVEIIKRYVSENPHITYVSETDSGQSNAMNKGIQLARGEYISFLNADDLYAPFTLNRIIQIFTNNKKLNFVSGNCKLINDKGELIYINRPARIKSYHLYSGKTNFPINPVAYFYKKEIHDRIGLYNVNNHFNMDYEFILLACLKYDLIYFNEDWGYAIQHAEAKTVKDIESNTMLKRKNELFLDLRKDISPTLKIISRLFSLYFTLRKK